MPSTDSQSRQEAKPDRCEPKQTMRRSWQNMTAQPITGKLTREIAMKRVSGEKTYSLTMILFRKKEPDEKKPPPPTENVDPVAKNLEEVRGTKAKLQKQKGFADLVQFCIVGLPGPLLPPKR